MHFKLTAARHRENFHPRNAPTKGHERGRKKRPSLCHIFTFPRYSLRKINFYPLPTIARRTDATGEIDGDFLVGVSLLIVRFLFYTRRRPEETVCINAISWRETRSLVTMIKSVKRKRGLWILQKWWINWISNILLKEKLYILRVLCVTKR